LTSDRLYCAGTTQAVRRAKQYLEDAGFPISEHPDWNTRHLLLDIPSFRAGDSLCSSGNLDTLLETLPHQVTVWGGNLNHPSLQGFHCVDLLQDEPYLMENAAITADCTLDLLTPMVEGIWKNRNVLVLGWGRIGKSLCVKLKALGCHVTVSARSEADLLHLLHLGYSVIHTAQAEANTADASVIINTVPSPVLTAESTADHRCIKVDLASVKGIEGSDVLWARGLPGRYAPEQSGRLIADTFLRLWKEEQK